MVVAVIRAAGVDTEAAITSSMLQESAARAALLVAGLVSLRFAGMMPMYLLMAAFHLAPWLRRTAARS